MTLSETPVAIITGGARGIGYATAEALGRDGYALVLADLDAAAGTEAAGTLEASGHTAVGVRTDVSDGTRVQARVDLVLDRYGRIDVLVNYDGNDGRAHPPSDAKT